MSIREEGTISVDDLEAELGVQPLKTVEYSQIVRNKLKNLRVRLTREYGAEVSKKL